MLCKFRVRAILLLNILSMVFTIVKSISSIVKLNFLNSLQIYTIQILLHLDLRLSIAHNVWRNFWFLITPPPKKITIRCSILNHCDYQNQSPSVRKIDLCWHKSLVTYGWEEFVRPHKERSDATDGFHLLLY